MIEQQSVILSFLDSNHYHINHLVGTCKYNALLSVFLQLSCPAFMIFRSLDQLASVVVASLIFQQTLCSRNVLSIPGVGRGLSRLFAFLLLDENINVNHA